MRSDGDHELRPTRDGRRHSVAFSSKCSGPGSPVNHRQATLRRWPVLPRRRSSTIRVRCAARAGRDSHRTFSVSSADRPWFGCPMAHADAYREVFRLAANGSEVGVRRDTSGGCLRRGTSTGTDGDRGVSSRPSARQPRRNSDGPSRFTLHSHALLRDESADACRVRSGIPSTFLQRLCSPPTAARAMGRCVT